MDLVTIILFIVGFVFLISGADLLVRGASHLALAVGITPLVVGLTVVAYGTSAPELAVSIQSSYAGAADIALGNVIGSNIANVLLILGASALIAPLMVSVQLIRLEVPLMIGVSILLWFLGLDGRIGRVDGLFFFGLGLLYTIFAIWQSRRETKHQAQPAEPHPEKTPGSGARLWQQLGLMVIGLVMLVLGANWLVNGAVALAEYVGLSELIIGLTVVAIGTSLPELATSIVASARGERDIAVGNIVGSNIFNILIVLGASSTISSAGINVSTSALGFDIPVMIVVAVACLPIFFTGQRIARWEGAIFLGYYVAYTLYLILNASQHQILPLFSWVMLVFVVPLTIITLLTSIIQAVRDNHVNPIEKTS